MSGQRPKQASRTARALSGLVAGCLLAGAPAAFADPRPGPGSEAGYHFSQDFMARAIPVWTELLAPYRGRKDLRYLEVGVFEGRSFVWMLDNVLTDPSCEAWAVDLFDGPFYELFLRNLLAGGHATKTRIRRGDSRKVLPTLPADAFDIVYIDGNHEGQYVLSDAVMAWQLLKDGGLLIFDDYRLDLRVGRPFPAQHLPGPAIDAFVSIYAEDIEVLHDGYQKILRKHIAHCDPIGCSALGPYSYQWYTKKLTKGPRDEPVELDEEERDVLERFLRSRLPGETRFSPPPELLSSPAWKRLTRQLAIEDLDERIVSEEELRAQRARKPADSY